MLAATLDGADSKTLRETLDKLKDRLQLGGDRARRRRRSEGEPCRGRHERSHREAEGWRPREFRRSAGRGKGGGRADMAQAGGTDASKLPAALGSVKDWVAQRLR